MCVHVPPKSLGDSLARGNPTPCFMGQPVGLEKGSGQYRLGKKGLHSLEKREAGSLFQYSLGQPVPVYILFTQHNAPYSLPAQHTSRRHRGSSSSRLHPHLRLVWQGSSSLLHRELRQNWRGIFQPLSFPFP